MTAPTVTASWALLGRALTNGETLPCEHVTVADAIADRLAR